MISPVKHTAIVVNYLRRETSEVILFYSGGKDSLVLLDMLAPYFKKIHCVFMEFVPGLQHLKPYMDWVRKYKNATLTILPHWQTSYYLDREYYTFPLTKKVKPFKQIDIENRMKQLTGCEWIVFGHRISDNLVRRLMLKNYKFDAIHEKQKKAYPLSHWSKKHIVSYMTIHQIIKPINYGNKKSNGIDLHLDVLLWLQKNAPGDLEKIYSVFPLSKQIIFEHEQQTKH